MNQNTNKDLRNETQTITNKKEYNQLRQPFEIR